MAHYKHPHARAVPLSVTFEAWLVVLSFALTILLLRSNIVGMIVDRAGDSLLLGSFIAGTLFTSILTTFPAIVGFTQIAPHLPAWQMALSGAVGAMIGDVFIFRFIRSRLVDYILKTAFSPRVLAFGKMIATGPLWWVSPILGALVIASPLPDEVGLLMMGLSRIRLVEFMVLSFIANAVGIFGIALAVQHFG